MSNYKHTSTVGDAHVVLETDDSDFMREYIKNEEITTYGVDHVINLSDIPMKADYINAIAESTSESSSLSAAVSELSDSLRRLSADFMHLQFDVNRLKNKEKRNGF